MRLSDCDALEFKALLQNGKVHLEFGPFTFRISSDIPGVSEQLKLLYHDHDLSDRPEFIDFDVSATKNSIPLGKWRPGASIYFNGYPVHGRFPKEHLYANLEWGMNWCIHKHTYDYLTLHCGTLEKNGKTLMLLGESGAGKSTLCAALAASGWRLMSDEMAVISIKTGEVQALARPIILKNQSIGIIKKLFPSAIFGQPSPGTIKGDVAHMRPPEDSVRRMQESSYPGWFCFPNWSPTQCPLTVEPMDPGVSFIKAAELSFNYRILGEPGFERLLDIVNKSECFSVNYHDIEEALEYFNEF